MLQPPKKFNPDPFAYHQEIELTIGSLTNMAQGVGRIGDWVVFVPSTIPGERVRARVYRNHKSHSDADLVEVLDPSPERIEPGCPLFGTCGGCQYQHIGYELQLEWKQRQVQELLQRMAKIDFQVSPVIPSPETYSYRSKITPHFQKPKSGELGPVGFLRQGQRQKIIDVPQCPIASPAINTALPGVRKEILSRAGSFKKGATLLLRDAGGKITTDPGDIVTEEVAGISFSFLARDFFQNNLSILPVFTDHVATQAAAGGNRFLIDAYCGSGLFCLTAADKFEQVAGIEISESSADWARHNAKTNGIENASFLAGSAEAIFENVSFPAAETAVIIDPPRKGCDETFLRQLFAHAPPRVIYVSCNPATQMRDLALFIEAGYALTNVQPFDLFPQTKHLECVMTFTRDRPS